MGVYDQGAGGELRAGKHVLLAASGALLAVGFASDDLSERMYGCAGGDLKRAHGTPAGQLGVTQAHVLTRLDLFRR